MASYCINTHSLMVQSINSLVAGISCELMIRMDLKLLFLEILTSNCGMICTWNGSAPKIFSPILRKNKQKIVRFIILIYNLDAQVDFDEQNYSLKFNHPSFRDIYNIYLIKSMSPFQYYPIVIY